MDIKRFNLIFKINLRKELFDSPDFENFVFPNWLDLGAGDGGALIRGVSPLAKQISATEICPD